MLIGATLTASGATPTGAMDNCSAVIHVDHTRAGSDPATTFGFEWGDAFWDLQDAIAAAESCVGITSHIWIAEGTYTPHPTDPTASFVLPNNVELIGGFDGTELSIDERPQFALPQTTLSGFIEADKSHRVVVVEAGTTGLLTDVNVEGGNADGLDGSPDSGGGIHVENFDAPRHTSRSSGETSTSPTTAPPTSAAESMQAGQSCSAGS